MRAKKISHRKTKEYQKAGGFILSYKNFMLKNKGVDGAPESIDIGNNMQRVFQIEFVIRRKSDTRDYYTEPTVFRFWPNPESTQIRRAQLIRKWGMLGRHEQWHFDIAVMVAMWANSIPDHERPPLKRVTTITEYVQARYDAATGKGTELRIQRLWSNRKKIERVIQFAAKRRNDWLEKQTKRLRNVI